MSATFTAVSHNCWKCGRDSASISTGDNRWFHPECMPNYSSPHPSVEITDLQRQLAEARARVAAMEKVVAVVRLALFRTHSGRYDLLRTHAKAVGEALAALPEPPEDVT